MKQIFKRFVSASLVALMVIFVLPVSAFADDSTNNDVIGSAMANTTRIVLVEDGVARDISYDEYMELTTVATQPVVFVPPETELQPNSVDLLQSGSVPALPCDYTVGYHYAFMPTSTSSGYLSEVRVSQIFQDATTVSVATTVTKERTITHSGGVTLTAAIKSTIFNSIEASYGYSASATSSTSVSITGEFTPTGRCKYCAVFFRPRVQTVTGTLNYYMAYMGETTLLSSTNGVKAQYPYTISGGLLDGIYLLKENDVESALE